MFDLAPAEWEAFAESIAAIAKGTERQSNAFECFQQWLER
jgi:hypothetical protein